MGPVASIYLPQKLRDDQLADVRDTIARISEHIDKSSVYCNIEFSTRDVRSLGGGLFDESGTFCTLLYSHYDYADQETPHAVEAEFRFIPQQTLQIASVGKTRNEHSIMGALLVYFAQKYDGVVDFSGAIFPPIPSHVDLDAWTEVAPYFEEMVKTMDGKVVTVDYETGAGKPWVYHLADAIFMKSWLNHPNFHLIK